ncbi:MAG: hypothetical protein KC502_09220 [Myxococcales bacterium]|nr:hypothetical protein [Myxococcales bacterium]
MSVFTLRAPRQWLTSGTATGLQLAATVLVSALVVVGTQGCTRAHEPTPTESARPSDAARRSVKNKGSDRTAVAPKTAATSPTATGAAKRSKRRAVPAAARAEIEALLGPQKLGPPAATRPAAARPAVPRRAAAKTVSVTGTARDAKQGAIVRADDGAAWLVGELQAWPAAVLGKRVIVRGLATVRDAGQGDNPLKNGLHSARASGRSAVISKPTWRLVTP